MKKRVISALLLSAVMLTFSSCGASGGTNSGDAPMTTAGGTKNGIAEGAPASDAPSYDESYDAGEYRYDDSFSGDESIVGDYSEKSGSPFIRDKEQRRAGVLTGGEWRDNKEFSLWRHIFDLRDDWADTAETWKLSTTDRVYVKVQDANGEPASGMTVKLSGNKTILWEAVSDSRGDAFLFPWLYSSDDNKTVPDEIIVESADGRAVRTELPAKRDDPDAPIVMTVPDSAPMRTKLDLMLMMDTTGSMGDELLYLKTELSNVIDRVKGSTGADVQLSVNFYRDTEDDYVVRDFGFTPNISIAIDHLNDQRASGGGDYPEAVTTALDNGLYKHQWRDDSEKIMLLVLDAPPHYSDGIEYLKPLMTKAAQMGVRIIPVASSGVDTDTEFICRCLAMTTGGTYTFLTDDSGVGNSHLEPTIGSYEVEKLNDMLVRIIKGYFER